MRIYNLIFYKKKDDTIQDEFIPQLDSDLKKYYEVIVKVILNELPISQEENENLFNVIFSIFDSMH